MNLTDNEIRDITKYLEAGKPLPDKYRFLLFDEKREVELVWNGKTDDICNVVLPFQVIEQVDEPRKEVDQTIQKTLFDIDIRGRQLKGWTNKLIWGDNKLILSSLKNGPLRKEIEDQGGIKLIYIDPPFDVGADFSMEIEIGDEKLTKEPGILEEIAYRDTWGKGADSFIAMMYERLKLMRDLLAEDGSIYVHCDWRMNSYLRLLMDEIFGKNKFNNEICWHYSGWNKKLKTSFEKRHDSIIFYSNKDDPIFNSYFRPWNSKEEYVKIRKQKVHKDDDNREYVLSDAGGGKRIRRYLDEVMDVGVVIDDVWDLDKINNSSKEAIGYPTQKPISLIERIIIASSNEGDIVADFFCGSGTTLSVAEKLGRKWIGSDLGKFAIHTTRKRIIGVQRELKSTDKDYRAFEILNLGKYERQHYIGISDNLRDEEKEKLLTKKEQDFITLIISAYHAEPVEGFTTFHGKKRNRMVVIGPVNLPVTRLFAEEVIAECRQKYITKVDILGFEYEMGLFPSIQEEAKQKGIDMVLKYIPPDVFDKRAIERDQVVFHDVSYIEITPHYKGNSIAVELTDFSVFYNQDTVDNAVAGLKNGGKKVVIENGRIVKVTKDKDGIVSREVLTKNWTDWIDYWAVDFDFESKKEFIRVASEDEEIKEVWTGEHVFENEWQSFRTRRDRNLELKCIFKECMPGRRKIAVKVVDIFGNDTMKIIDVNIGSK